MKRASRMVFVAAGITLPALLVFLVFPVQALTQIWGTPVVPDSTNAVGRYTSMAVINGYPAISYRDINTGNLKFVRANDASGNTWGIPLDIDTAGSILAENTSLAEVNGYPAVSYYDRNVGDLKYIRATNASGTSWGAPIAIDGLSGPTPPFYYAGKYTSLAVVNGYPAISYYDETNGELKYVRAADADGTTWGEPGSSNVSDDVGQYTSLAVVNGYPAISFYDATNGNLMYLRAEDANGDTWGTPLNIDTGGNVGQYTSLTVVNGDPAISYYDATNGNLKYVRATNASGTAWGTPVAIDTGGNVGQYTSLAVVNGYPAISYYDVTNTSLKYVQASDASGNTWGTPVTVDSTGEVGEYASMAVVNGRPAISYFDYSNYDLRYVRMLGTVDISVLDGSTPVPDGTGSVDFGTTSTGTPVTRSLTIENNGSLALNLNAISLPSGFSLINAFSVIPAGGSTTLQVRLDALTQGSYSGTLSLGSTDTSQSPYQITISGTVNTLTPDISVMDGSTPVPDGTGSVDFGTTPAGTPVTKSLTIENNGSIELNLNTISLPSGFSLINAFSVIPVGDSTTLQVRLDAQAQGSYSGTLSLGSTDTSQSPYEFTISGTVTGDTVATITSDTPDPSASGESVTVRWTVTGSSGTPTGTVTVTTDRSAASCSDTVAAGSCDITLAAGGTHTLTAEYSGDSSFNASSDTAVHEVDAVAPEVADVAVQGSAAGTVVGLDQIAVVFSEDVQDGGCPDGAECPGNYSLTLDGTAVTISSISYDPDTHTAILNLASDLANGDYVLVVSGTTSIIDLSGNSLDGGSGSPSDFTLNFSLDLAASSGGSGGDTGGNTSGSGVTGVSTLPETGFPQGKVSVLAAQPDELAYDDGDLRLLIPGLGVDTGITGVPLVDGTWDVSWLGRRVGYLEGTSYPTWTGNTVITGHVWDASNQPGPFVELGRLVYGDQVMIETSSAVYTYEVRESYSVFPDDLSVLAHSEYDTLTLITCQGYNETSEQYNFRRVVRAILVHWESE